MGQREQYKKLLHDETEKTRRPAATLDRTDVFNAIQANQELTGIDFYGRDVFDLADQLGLEHDDVIAILPDLKHQVDIASEVTARRKHEAKKTDPTIGKLKRFARNVKLSVWDEKLEVLGIGSIPAAARERRGELLRSTDDMTKIMKALLERRSMSKRLDNYKQIVRNADPQAGASFEALLREYQAGVGHTDTHVGLTSRDVMNNQHYQQAVEKILDSINLTGQFSLDGTGQEIVNLDTQPELIPVIKNHLRFILRSEILQLTDAENLELLSSQEYESDKAKPARIAAKVLASGTLWAVAAKSGAKLVMGSSVAAVGMGAVTVLSGGTGLAIAAGLGAVGGVVRECVNAKDHAKQRKMDRAVGGLDAAHVVDSRMLNNNLQHQLQTLQAEINAGRITDTNLLNLYATVADAQNRLLKMRTGKIKDRQDYINFGLEHRFEAQLELLQQLEQATEVLDKAIQNYSGDRTALQRNIARRHAGVALDLKHAADSQRKQDLKQEAGRVIISATFGAVAASAASYAMDWLDHTGASAPKGPEFKPTFSENSTFNFSQDGKTFTATISKAGELQIFSTADPGVMTTVPLKGIDPHDIILKPTATNLEIYSPSTGESLGSIDVMLQASSAAANVTKEALPGVKSNLNFDQSLFTKIGDKGYRLILQNNGQLQVAAADLATKRATETLSSVNIFDDSIADNATLKNQAGQLFVEFKDNQFVVKTVYDNHPIASIQLGQDTVAKAATVTAETARTPDISAVFKPETQAGKLLSKLGVDLSKLKVDASGDVQLTKDAITSDHLGASPWRQKRLELMLQAMRDGLLQGGEKDEIILGRLERATRLMLHEKGPHLNASAALREAFGKDDAFIQRVEVPYVQGLPGSKEFTGIAKEWHGTVHEFQQASGTGSGAPVEHAVSAGKDAAITVHDQIDTTDLEIIRPAGSDVLGSNVAWSEHTVLDNRLAATTALLLEITQNVTNKKLQRPYEQTGHTRLDSEYPNVEEELTVTQAAQSLETLRTGHFQQFQQNFQQLQTAWPAQWINVGGDVVPIPQTVRDQELVAKNLLEQCFVARDGNTALRDPHVLDMQIPGTGQRLRNVANDFNTALETQALQFDRRLFERTRQVHDHLYGRFTTFYTDLQDQVIRNTTLTPADRLTQLQARRQQLTDRFHTPVQLLNTDLQLLARRPHATLSGDIINLDTDLARFNGQIGVIDGDLAHYIDQAQNEVDAEKYSKDFIKEYGTPFFSALIQTMRTNLGREPDAFELRRVLKKALDAKANNVGYRLLPSKDFLQAIGAAVGNRLVDARVREIIANLLDVGISANDIFVTITPPPAPPAPTPAPPRPAPPTPTPGPTPAPPGPTPPVPPTPTPLPTSTPGAPTPPGAPPAPPAPATPDQLNNRFGGEYGIQLNTALIVALRNKLSHPPTKDELAKYTKKALDAKQNNSTYAGLSAAAFQIAIGILDAAGHPQAARLQEIVNNIIDDAQLDVFAQAPTPPTPPPPAAPPVVRRASATPAPAAAPTSPPVPTPTPAIVTPGSTPPGPTPAATVGGPPTPSLAGAAPIEAAPTPEAMRATLEVIKQNIEKLQQSVLEIQAQPVDVIYRRQYVQMSNNIQNLESTVYMMSQRLVLDLQANVIPNLSDRLTFNSKDAKQQASEWIQELSGYMTMTSERFLDRDQLLNVAFRTHLSELQKYYEDHKDLGIYDIKPADLEDTYRSADILSEMCNEYVSLCIDWNHYNILSSQGLTEMQSLEGDAQLTFSKLSEVLKKFIEPALLQWDIEAQLDTTQNVLTLPNGQSLDLNIPGHTLEFGGTTPAFLYVGYKKPGDTFSSSLTIRSSHANPDIFKFINYLHNETSPVLYNSNDIVRAFEAFKAQLSGGTPPVPETPPTAPVSPPATEIKPLEQERRGDTIAEKETQILINKLNEILTAKDYSKATPADLEELQASLWGAGYKVEIAEVRNQGQLNDGIFADSGKPLELQSAKRGEVMLLNTTEPDIYYILPGTILKSSDNMRRIRSMLYSGEFKGKEKNLINVLPVVRKEGDQFYIISGGHVTQPGSVEVHKPEQPTLYFTPQRADYMPDAAAVDSEVVAANEVELQKVMTELDVFESGTLETVRSNMANLRHQWSADWVGMTPEAQTALRKQETETMALMSSKCAEFFNSFSQRLHRILRGRDQVAKDRWAALREEFIPLVKEFYDQVGQRTTELQARYKQEYQTLNDYYIANRRSSKTLNISTLRQNIIVIEDLSKRMHVDKRQSQLIQHADVFNDARIQAYDVRPLTQLSGDTNELKKSLERVLDFATEAQAATLVSPAEAPVPPPVTPGLTPSEPVTHPPAPAPTEAAAPQPAFNEVENKKQITNWRIDKNFDTGSNELTLWDSATKVPMAIDGFTLKNSLYISQIEYKRAGANEFASADYELKIDRDYINGKVECTFTPKARYGDAQKRIVTTPAEFTAAMDEFRRFIPTYEAAQQERAKQDRIESGYSRLTSLEKNELVDIYNGLKKLRAEWKGQWSDLSDQARASLRGHEIEVRKDFQTYFIKIAQLARDYNDLRNTQAIGTNETLGALLDRLQEEITELTKEIYKKVVARTETLQTSYRTEYGDINDRYRRPDPKTVNIAQLTVDLQAAQDLYRRVGLDYTHAKSFGKRTDLSITDLKTYEISPFMKLNGDASRLVDKLTKLLQETQAAQGTPPDDGSTPPPPTGAPGASIEAASPVGTPPAPELPTGPTLPEAAGVESAAVAGPTESERIRAYTMGDHFNGRTGELALWDDVTTIDLRHKPESIHASYFRKLDNGGLGLLYVDRENEALCSVIHINKQDDHFEFRLLENIPVERYTLGKSAAAYNNVTDYGAEVFSQTARTIPEFIAAVEQYKQKISPTNEPTPPDESAAPAGTLPPEATPGAPTPLQPPMYGEVEAAAVAVPEEVSAAVVPTELGAATDLESAEYDRAAEQFKDRLGVSALRILEAAVQRYVLERKPNEPVLTLQDKQRAMDVIIEKISVLIPGNETDLGKNEIIARLGSAGKVQTTMLEILRGQDTNFKFNPANRVNPDELFAGRYDDALLTASEMAKRFTKVGKLHAEWRTLSTHPTTEVSDSIREHEQQLLNELQLAQQAKDAAFTKMSGSLAKVVEENKARETKVTLRDKLEQEYGFVTSNRAALKNAVEGRIYAKKKYFSQLRDELSLYLKENIDELTVESLQTEKANKVALLQNMLTDIQTDEVWMQTNREKIVVRDTAWDEETEARHDLFKIKVEDPSKLLSTIMEMYDEAVVTPAPVELETSEGVVQEAEVAEATDLGATEATAAEEVTAREEATSESVVVDISSPTPMVKVKHVRIPERREEAINDATRLMLGISNLVDRKLRPVVQETLNTVLHEYSPQQAILAAVEMRTRLDAVDKISTAFRAAGILMEDSTINTDRLADWIHTCADAVLTGTIWEPESASPEDDSHVVDQDARSDRRQGTRPFEVFNQLRVELETKAENLKLKYEPLILTAPLVATTERPRTRQEFTTALEEYNGVLNQVDQYITDFQTQGETRGVITDELRDYKTKKGKTLLPTLEHWGNQLLRQRFEVVEAGYGWLREGIKDVSRRAEDITHSVDMLDDGLRAQQLHDEILPAIEQLKADVQTLGINHQNPRNAAEYHLIRELRNVIRTAEYTLGIMRTYSRPTRGGSIETTKLEDRKWGAEKISRTFMQQEITPRIEGLSPIQKHAVYTNIVTRHHALTAPVEGRRDSDQRTQELIDMQLLISEGNAVRPNNEMIDAIVTEIAQTSDDAIRQRDVAINLAYALGGRDLLRSLQEKTYALSVPAQTDIIRELNDRLLSRRDDVMLAFAKTQPELKVGPKVRKLQPSIAGKLRDKKYRDNLQSALLKDQQINLMGEDGNLDSVRVAEFIGNIFNTVERKRQRRRRSEEIAAAPEQDPALVIRERLDKEFGFGNEGMNLQIVDVIKEIIGEVIAVHPELQPNELSPDAVVMHLLDLASEGQNKKRSTYDKLTRPEVNYITVNGEKGKEEIDFSTENETAIKSAVEQYIKDYVTLRTSRAQQT